MDELKFAFQFASDVTKQLITLSTGVMVLMVTYSSGVLKNPTKRIKIALLQCEACFIVSIVFGLLSLMAMTGAVSANSPEGIYASSIRFMSMVQIFFFLFALLFTARFGFLSLGVRQTEDGSVSQNSPVENIKAENKPD